MTNRYKKSTKTFQSIVEQLVKKLGIEEDYTLSLLIEEWETIIGTRVANVCKVVSLKDGKLLVETDSSTWRVELIMRAEEIKNIINKHFASDIVHTIVFK